VHTREVKGDDFYGREFIQAAGAAGLTPPSVPSAIKAIKIVSNPVKRPGDNMLLHLETERILYELEVGSSMVEGKLILSEFGFNVDGQNLPLLIRETKTGVEVWVRESFWRSFENAFRAGSTIASNLQLLTSNFNETTRLQLEAYRRVEHATGNRSLMILVTPEVIRQNYGFAQTANLLGSLGHRVVVLENPAWTAKDREQFYRDYALEGLLNKTVYTVEDNTSALKMRLSEIAGSAISFQDTVVMSFANQELAEVPEAVTRVVIDPEVLSVTSGRRADYPVAFLAAQILLEPDEVEKLGEEIISRIVTTEWQLHQSPSGGSVSESLRSEIEHYQALAQAA